MTQYLEGGKCNRCLSICTQIVVILLKMINGGFRESYATVITTIYNFPNGFHHYYDNLSSLESPDVLRTYQAAPSRIYFLDLQFPLLPRSAWPSSSTFKYSLTVTNIAKPAVANNQIARRRDNQKICKSGQLVVFSIIHKTLVSCQHPSTSFQCSYVSIATTFPTYH